MSERYAVRVVEQHGRVGYAVVDLVCSHQLYWPETYALYAVVSVKFRARRDAEDELLYFQSLPEPAQHKQPGHGLPGLVDAAVVRPGGAVIVIDEVA